MELHFRSTGQTPHRVGMHWTGGNLHPEIDALRPLEGRGNYLLGDDRPLARGCVPHYEEARYREIYPGVDLSFHGTFDSGQNELEYDLIVAAIRVEFNSSFPE